MILPYNAFGVRSLRIIAAENGDYRLGCRWSFRWSPWSFSVVVLMRTSIMRTSMNNYKSKNIWEHQWTSIMRTWSTNLWYSWITSHVCFPVKGGTFLPRSQVPRSHEAHLKVLGSSVETEFLLRFRKWPHVTSNKSRKGSTMFNIPPFLQFCDCIFLYFLSFWLLHSKHIQLDDPHAAMPHLHEAR